MQQLDTKKIRVELAKIDHNYVWLAKEIGYTRQYVNHLIKTKSILHIDKIADALGLDPKDLIK